MQPEMIVAAIAKARRGIARYLDIMAQLPTVNVVEDKAFQRRFNAFYRFSQRPATWYQTYYACMQECRTIRPAPTFDDVLDHLGRSLGRYEPSFASKFVATLDPAQPIWDAFVLANTGVKRPSYASKTKVSQAKLAYRAIQDWYARFLASHEGRLLIRIFSDTVDEHDRISDLKKVDFVLWQTRDPA